jgi:hypothetical protein
MRATDHLTEHPESQARFVRGHELPKVPMRAATKPIMCRNRARRRNPVAPDRDQGQMNRDATRFAISMPPATASRADQETQGLPSSKSINTDAVTTPRPRTERVNAGRIVRRKPSTGPRPGR